MEARSAAGRPPLVGNSDEEEDELESVMLLEMPPGFRFHPTDEEIIIHYLLKKLMDRRFSSLAIADVDLNKCEPWDLPKKAKKTGEKEWFVFWQRDKKYPTGKRTNRATESGFWKATGKDKEIHMKGRRNCLVGMRKTLVFYKGRAPKGENTNWVMHEFRSEGNFSHYNLSSTAKEEWVVCRVFQKKTGTRTNPCVKLARIDSFVDHLLDIPTLSPSSSFLTTHDDDEDEIRNELIICGSLSRPTPTTMFNKHQNDQNNFLLPPLCNYNIYPIPPFINPQIAHPNSVFTPHQSSPSLTYQYDQDVTAMHPTHFPCNGEDQLQNLRMCKMEPSLSSQNCVISHEMITSVQYSKGEDIIESNKAFDDQQLDQSFSFSPDISDLDSLWSY